MCYAARATFVEIPFTVKDNKGKLVSGLTWRDVRVYENNLRQQLALFTVDPFPLSVALVIDQSMTLRQYGEGEQFAGCAAGSVYTV